MIRTAVNFMYFIKTRSWCNIYLAAYYRLYPLFFTLVVKINCSIHITMVCNCNSTLAKFFCLCYKLF